MSKKAFVSNKRNRVSGMGPHRRDLPNFYYIGKIDKKIKKEIFQIVDSVKWSNDLYTDDYKISKFCDLRKQLPRKHVNILLQKPSNKSDGMNEKDYLIYDKLKENSLLKKFLQEKFHQLYRLRIAILPPKSEISWHIDMNTTVSCRFHILLKNSDFIFEVKRRDVIERVPFEEGDIYFTNTAYPHRVSNPTNRKRISLLFDIEYNNVKNLLPIMKQDD